MQNFKTYIIDLFSKIFTIKNLIKVLTIFIVGFSSRVFIKYIYKINVFLECLSPVSITYYLLFASFVVFINELFSTINFSILPYFVDYISRIYSLWFNLFKFKLSYKYLRYICSRLYSYFVITNNQTLNNVQDSLDDSLVLRMNSASNNSNNTSNNASSSNNSLGRAPIDSFLSQEERERLVESRNEASRRRRREGQALSRRPNLNRMGDNSGSRYGAYITRIRREEMEASNQRWEAERSQYPNLTRRMWILQIEGPRRRDIISRRISLRQEELRNANLPSLSQLPISSSSYNTAILDRGNLPPILNNQGNTNNNNSNNNNYTDNNNSNSNSNNN
jgi:hypothetical protein